MRSWFNIYKSNSTKKQKKTNSTVYNMHKFAILCVQMTTG